MLPAGDSQNGANARTRFGVRHATPPRFQQDLSTYLDTKRSRVAASFSSISASLALVALRSMFFNKKKDKANNGTPAKVSLVFVQERNAQRIEADTSQLPCLSNPQPAAAPMMDDDTVQQGNLTPTLTGSSKKPAAAAAPGSPAELLSMTEKELVKAKEQVAQEKAAKRKLYSSLVKLANELKKTRSEIVPLQAEADYNAQSWYEGGMWRRPEVLPGVSSSPAKRIQFRQAIGLSDLFFNLVTVTAFTRVGMAVSEHNGLEVASLLYFGVFWMIWSKETSYSTRFDTTDLSAQLVTLLTCFALLFGSLSTTSPINSEDGTRIMMVAGFVAFLHFLLHVRVALWYRNAFPDTIESYVRSFAIMTMILTLLETIVWVVGIFVLPVDFPYRWAIFLAGILLSMRIPRSFLSNDFHGT